MAGVTASAAPITPRSGGGYVVTGAVEGMKMETKWGGIAGLVIGTAAGGLIGARSGRGAEALGLALFGGAVGAGAGALSLLAAGTLHGVGAGVANAIGDPVTADDVHTNSVIGGAVAGVAIGALGSTKGVHGLAAGVVVGGLWGGLMGHFIANRID